MLAHQRDLFVLCVTIWDGQHIKDTYEITYKCKEPGYDGFYQLFWRLT